MFLISPSYTTPLLVNFSDFLIFVPGAKGLKKKKKERGKEGNEIQGEAY